MAVETSCEIARGRPYVRTLLSDARRLMRLLGLEGCELSLMIVGDDTMRDLNRRFRRKDRPTDVLSFPQFKDLRELANGRAQTRSPRRPAIALGDVVISIDTALAQARRRRIAPAARIRELLTHGVLHLLGYDHERSVAEARRMFARERQLGASLAGAGRGARPARATPRTRVGRNAR